MALETTALEIPDVLIVKPKRFADARGHFSEVYNRGPYSEAGIASEFMQDNQSLSVSAGTVRGLHYQAPPFAQAKLVRVLRGAIVDVAVDVRSGSPTYGEWVKAVLTVEGGEQLFVPRGFLHGFATLEPNTVVHYKVDAPYSKAHDGGVLWNDPDLAIDWGIGSAPAVVSEKDADAVRFRDFKSPF
jgi:dTDP-4-dehydrorhamnose 3,5-epimerase